MQALNTLHVQNYSSAGMLNIIHASYSVNTVSFNFHAGCETIKFFITGCISYGSTHYKKSTVSSVTVANYHL